MNQAMTESRARKKLSGVARSDPSNRQDLHPSSDNITFSNAVNEATAVMTDDPVMSAIFADTARTTLQTQYGTENANPRAMMGAVANHHSDEAAQAVAANPIEDLFEGAGNWAALAFSEKKVR